MEKKQTPESKKRAIQKYLSKFVDMKIRVTPEYHEIIKQHAASLGESSAAFIKRAIAETMERDKNK